MKRLAALLLTCACCACACCASASSASETPAGAPLQLPAPPAVQLAQKLGDTVPLDLTLQQAEGGPVRLRELFAGPGAVVLVPGYYQCPQLCGLVMQGVLEALAKSGLPPRAWRIVGFSIDPQDTPATARAREADYRAYARFVAPEATPPVDLHLLTSDAATSAALAQALGYAVQSTGPGAPIAHSAGFVVATPGGRIARYFPGVRFDARELRLAVTDAAGGRVGSLSDRLTLLCGHYDPVTGRYSLAVMAWLRVLGCAGALALAAWVWRRRHGRTPGPPTSPPVP
jgi:protein SCO1/2